MVVGNLDILRCIVGLVSGEWVFVPFVVASKVSAPQLLVIPSMQCCANVHLIQFHSTFAMYRY